MMHRFVVSRAKFLLIVGGWLFVSLAAFSQSATWVNFGTNGILVYTNDSLGNHLIDYSYAGYMGGGVAIPTNIAVQETLSPSGGDDTAAIQNAINAVGNLTANGSGIRGEVLLNPGTYTLSGTLSISKSGVVLHGSGTNTILNFTSTANTGTAINIAGSSGTTQISGSQTYTITDPYVPLGATSFHLNSVSGLAPGTNIVVRRPWTTAWVNAIGMSNYWTASGHQSDAERRITAISNNQVTVDIPLPTPIEQAWCTGTVFPYTDSGRVQQCAVENLTMVSEWGLGTTGNTNGFGWTGVNFGNAKNCWARNIAFSGFGGEAINTAPDTQSKWITAQDCTYANGVNNGSARPGAFQIEGQMCLYQRLTGVSGFEHLCQSLDEATGPNVFLYCNATGQDFDGGPHRFWATSLLTDNESGTVGNVHITIITGGDNGWGAGYSTFYNCHTSDHLIQCPAVTNHYNWWIGGSGTQDSPGSTPGIFDHDGTTVTPTSLYLEQLKERLGGAAVENIGYTLFSISNSPSLLAVTAGTNTTCTVKVGDPTLMSNVVALSVSGLPANSGASFNTNSVKGSGNVTLTVVASNSIASGTYLLNIIGTSAGLSHTSQVSLVVGNFSISANPNSQAVLAGNNINYTITLAANNGFAGSVNFGISGLPSGASANFSPISLSGNGNSTLQVSTTTGASPGNWILTIFGTNGSTTLSTTALLEITNVSSNPGTLVWTNGATDMNWSSELNWTNITGTGYGPPQSDNDVVFTNISTLGATNIVNNVVNGNFTVGSLTYEQTVGYHTTQIQAGATLNITDANGVFVGTGQDDGAGQLIMAWITGAGGSLVMNNASANFNVRQGSTSSGSHRATLDASGLDTMSITAARLLVAGDNVQTANGNRPAGTLLLAKTNMVSVSGSSPAINVADDGANGGSGSISLGISNAIYADTITIGREKSSGTLNFNPVFTNLAPTFYLHGQTSSRVGTLAIGDNSAQSASSSSSSGAVDFSGGTVDIMAGTILLGNGQTSSGSGAATGTLTLSGGTINVNTLEAGYANAANAGSVASGTVNVNGGTLLVNSLLLLAHSAGSSSNAPVGTLNVNGGIVQATNIIGGGGISTINLSSGTMDLLANFLAPGIITNVSTLSIGSPTVNNPALLENAAGISASNTILIANNGALAGNTLITAPGLVINGVISPGAGGAPDGMTNSGVAMFGTNGNFVVTVQNANGTPVGGWSFLQNSGQINVQATSGNPFTINPVSFDPNNSGLVTNFNSNTNYNWTFATANAGITNFNANDFTVDSSLFLNDLAGGYFYIRTNANSLVLAFTNNHPPMAGTTVLFRTSNTMAIPITDLTNTWSDPDGDPVALAGINSSTNGASLGNDGNFIYYTNISDVADEIFYTVEDIRTNPPAIYRLGDTQRTAVGEIVLLLPPTISKINISGNNIIFNGTGGLPGSNYYLLDSTNLLLPLNQWQRLGTSNFDASGNFSFTNSSAPNLPQVFYLLQVPN